MTRETTLAAGRAAAETGMMDACTITRDTVTAVNTQTGVQTITTATLYTGICRIKKTGGASGTKVGGAYQLMLGLQVELPFIAETDGLQPGDKVTITASRNEPELVGRVMRIHDLAHESEATSRKFAVQEVA